MPENAKIGDRLNRYADFIDEAIGQDPENLNVGVAWAQERIEAVTEPAQTVREAMKEINDQMGRAMDAYVELIRKP